MIYITEYAVPAYMPVHYAHTEHNSHVYHSLIVYLRPNVEHKAREESDLSRSLAARGLPYTASSQDNGRDTGNRNFHATFHPL